MKKFDESKLKERLTHVPGHCRIAFALSAASRCIRSFEHNSAMDTGVPDLSLRHYVIWLRDNLDADPIEEIDLIVEKILTLTPDDESRTGYWGALAEDACAALAYAYRCKLTADPMEAVWAARRSYEAADQFFLATSGTQLGSAEDEQKILGSEVIQRELIRQERDLELTEQNEVGKLLSLVLAEDILNDDNYI